MVCKSPNRDLALFPVRSIDYQYHVTTVFPQAISTDQVTTSYTLSSIFARSQSNGIVSEDNILQRLLIVDYRYSRFALDPRSGLFTMVRSVTDLIQHSLSQTFSRDWRDPLVTSLSSIQSGVAGSNRKQRLLLFGNNEIEIESKSTISLLIDEVWTISLILLNLKFWHLSISGYSSFLCFPNCEHRLVDAWRLLLLCFLHRINIYRHHHGHSSGD